MKVNTKVRYGLRAILQIAERHPTELRRRRLGAMIHVAIESHRGECF